jgi:hypothetical protein
MRARWALPALLAAVAALAPGAAASAPPAFDDCALPGAGVLVHSIDSPLRSGQAPVRVVDAQPGSVETPGCRDLDVATLEAGGPSSVELPGGVSVELVGQSAQRDTVRVTRLG